MSVQEKVQIYVNEKDSSSIIKPRDTLSQTYIIETNNKLQCTIFTLRESLHEVKSERDEFEDDLGKRERSCQYMRGLLKNFIAMNAEYKSINKTYEKVVKNKDTIFKRYNREIKYLKVGMAMQCILMLLSLFFPSWRILMSTVFVGNALLYTVYLNKVMPYNKVILNDIKNKKIEIKKIEDACDFLNNYIDNL